jgi:two-component system LytT family response regulator
VEVVERLSAIVADDEPSAREHLAALLDSLGVRVLASCSDGMELRDAVAQFSPDALFIDIEMPELDGVSAVASLPLARRPLVVFVTAHDAFAVRAFDLEAVDYVLKPYREERIARALERVRRARANPPASPRPSVTPGERFLVMTSGTIVVIDEREIDYVEAAGNYVRLHTAGRHPLLRETLRAIERKLDREQFARTHRSFLVRLTKIRQLVAQAGGDYAAVLIDGREVPVGRTYRDELLARLGGRGKR